MQERIRLERGQTFVAQLVVAGPHQQPSLEKESRLLLYSSTLYKIAVGSLAMLAGGGAEA